MVEEFELKAISREGQKITDVREKDKIPAIAYGSDFENKIVAVDKLDFGRVFHEAGESTLINLKIDNATPIKVLIYEVQIDPVTENAIHVDFYKVNMKEKIKTEIPLKQIGESPVIIDFEGTLVTNKDSVDVECLPIDLVHEIEVDISVLKTFDDVIKIADIKAPAGIVILDDPEEVAILVQPPRSEEELAELEEKPEEKVEEVEVEGEKPEEGDKAAEGGEVAEGKGGKAASTETAEVKPTEIPKSEK